MYVFLSFSVFNVGEYRRKATEKYKSHEFFDPNNREAMSIREYVNNFGISPKNKHVLILIDNDACTRCSSTVCVLIRVLFWYH